jgi:hypothetical protein
VTLRVIDTRLAGGERSEPGEVHRRVERGTFDVLLEAHEDLAVRLRRFCSALAFSRACSSAGMFLSVSVAMTTPWNRYGSIFTCRLAGFNRRLVPFDLVRGGMCLASQHVTFGNRSKNAVASLSVDFGFGDPDTNAGITCCQCPRR